ncbi:uncharacterized protein YkwD [Flavobacterium sp. 7E]|uniref:CAP domain-containing protein n=1 Tax=unclassified Flavobacterium TaxID=196869 RepID=UPI00156F0C05|nr:MULTISPECIES: CAP domain-containing protein [unclassified Flavobacterium]NRS90588.1 uncharacterized protein YkwD [Flavobacterium sp. 7E]NRT17156.1 uncharacterized protein YkwD [Flavobacterium sp. 28A]
MKKKILSIVVLSLTLFVFNSCTSDNTLNNEVPIATISVSAQKVESEIYNSDELEVMNLINVYRISIDLKPLEKSNFISFKSAEHNKYMIANNVVNHAGFEARSESIINTLSATATGENIAYNYNNAQSVLDAWLKSSFHKENIEGNFTHFGISIQIDSKTGRKYYTNIFAKI